jgi:hypothetical protein
MQMMLLREGLFPTLPVETNLPVSSDSAAGTETEPTDVQIMIQSTILLFALRKYENS